MKHFRRLKISWCRPVGVVLLVVCAVFVLPGCGRSNIEKLKDKDPQVRRAAAKALGDMGPAAKEAVPALIAALKDKDVAIPAAMALGKIGPVASPGLITALKEKDINARINAATAFAFMGPAAAKDKNVVPALASALKDESVNVRVMAALVLRDLGLAAKEAVPALTDALMDDSKHVRDIAQETLKKIQAEK